MNKYGKLVKISAFSSVTVAIILILAKAIAWWLSGSVSLLAGLTDSLLDGLASLLNLVAITIALKPADHDHRFGHGKAEALAALAQATLISFSALFVIYASVNRFINPIPIENANAGIAVIVFSLIVTIILISFQHYVIKKTNSTAIKADSLHYKSDIFMNIGILCALVLTSYGWQRSDAVFGILISFYILKSAIDIGKEATETLMDKELPKDITEQILTIAKNIPNIIDVHDIKTRKSGTQWFIQMHVELPADISLKEAHDHCLLVRKSLQDKWPMAEIIIHADPI